MSTPWIIVNAGRGGRLECLRCGRFHMPTFPIETWAMTALLDGFIKEHKGCKEGPDGKLCSMCMKPSRGHTPETCPELAASTPEAWLSGPDTGASSMTIYSVLYRQVYRSFFEPRPPLDPSDFGRCYRLLKLFPAWRARLPEVAAKYPAWRGLVEAWDDLTALYEEELPSGKAPKLYARMKHLLGQ